jgi:membrane fusion protein (multidrug efflux system)
MASLRKNNEVSAQSSPIVTALVQAPQDSSPAAAPTPAVAPDKTAPSSFIVPVIAITVALSAVAGAGANWDWWVASRAIQTTDDAAVFADVSSISARIGGTIQTISVGDYAQVKVGTPVLIV